MKFNVTKDQVRFMGMVNNLVNRSSEGDAAFVPLSKATAEDLERRIVYVDDPSSNGEYAIVQRAEVDSDGKIVVSSVRGYDRFSGNVDVMAEHSDSDGWRANILVEDPEDPDVDYSKLPLDSEVFDRALIVIKNGDWECCD